MHTHKDLFLAVLYISADFWHATTINTNNSRNLSIRAFIPNIKKTYDVRGFDMRTKYGVNFLLYKYFVPFVSCCLYTIVW